MRHFYVLTCFSIGAKKGKQPLPPNNPVSQSPPPYLSDAPALPPRPSKPGYQDQTPPPNYHSPSHPPPHLHPSQQPSLPSRGIPPPGILSRPPIGGYPPQGGVDMGGGYEEAEDIYGTMCDYNFKPYLICTVY